MNSGYLSDYFSGVGIKTLTKVDATSSSNQHEVGDSRGGATMMRILGDRPRMKNDRFEARYIYLCREQETISDEGYVSWYDTRANKPDRDPEWRLYYQSNAVTSLMDEGDTLILARTNEDVILFVVIPADSSILGEAKWLFGFHQQEILEFEAKPLSEANDSQLDFISRFILDEIGIEFEDPNANSLDSIIERFGFQFPKTVEFSDLARLTLPEVDAAANPDAALIAWLNHEEALFRRLEKRILADRLAQGFHDGKEADVDGFIKFSLGVHNRRKSRMGYALQNHLAAVFDASNLRYEAQVKTENGKTPDFLFPGADEYFDVNFPVGLLTMLAAKSSCKERWAQILPEAERIPDKHLVTLEPGISEPQTDQMKAAKVQLIVPTGIASSFTLPQRKWIWSVSDFVAYVSERQGYER